MEGMADDLVGSMNCIVLVISAGERERARVRVVVQDSILPASRR